MKNILHIAIGLFAALLFVNCEDLEDTYDEYTGDGKIRYVGKIDSIDIKPGWNRLQVIWRNPIDPAVKRVKVTWQSELDDKPFTRYIEKQGTDYTAGVDTIFLENLQDAVYTVRLLNQVADSTESMANEYYARPYTSEHENLRSFSRGIVNFYRLGGKLAVILDEDNENLKNVELHFTGTDGKAHSWNIKKHMTDSIIISSMYGDENLGRDYMFLLPERESECESIDFTKDLIIKRRGILPGCIDEIVFKDEALVLEEKVWSPGFSSWLKNTYGPDWEYDADTITHIELDYTITTLQDLLYFPSLKKVSLAKNRFMVKSHNNPITSFQRENPSTTDVYKGLMTLQFLKDIQGVSVDVYNDNFFSEAWDDTPNYIYAGKVNQNLLARKTIKHQKQPSITPLDTTDWIVTCSDTTVNGYKTNGAAWLLDGDPNTYFSPRLTSSTTIIEVKFDMKNTQTVHGFKVTQPNVNYSELKYLLSNLKIEVSEDGFDWDCATYVDGGINIGNNIGESTFIQIPEILQKPVRYIRLTMTNNVVSGTSDDISLYSLRLGDFIPY